jgi:hypothetical protein
MEGNKQLHHFNKNYFHIEHFPIIKQKMEKQYFSNDTIFIY